MHTFEIRDQFLLDGEPFRILSGAVHYFRVHPSDWHHSLYNLKAMGFNTVETYVPWNLHEPRPGEFDFSGALSIARFLDEAAELGLWAIVRPSPFICAEWEFGGMPAWLLEDRSMRPRSRDPRFLECVARYYDALMPTLVDRQVTHGGNVIMMQVENEYGSYCEDKEYLRAIRDLMTSRGVDVPLCTSDGPWRGCLRAGTLIDDDVLATGNFGSRAAENFAQLKAFHEEHGKNWPLMCMEFWDGWFNRWGENVIRRDAQDLADSVRELLELGGSISLYMFHGGTNFGFMNGCSARHTHDLHQVTSYDYDAPLDEEGNPTEKWYKLRDVVRDLFPGNWTADPLVKTAVSVPAEKIELKARTGLFENLSALDSAPVRSLYPQCMEDMGQSYGYVLYRTQVERDTAEPERIRVIDGRDRAQVFVNGVPVATQYQEHIGEDIRYALPEPTNRLDVLVENMGRVNYGHRLLADTQRKGIRTGVCVDLHFVLDWEAWRLSLEDVSAIDYSAGWEAGTPSFSRFEFTLDEPADTYIDTTGFGKGVAFVNGANVGRYWEIGPIATLYVPHGMTRAGVNELVLFETEGTVSDTISLRSAPLINHLEKEGVE
ncbi:glycoside hydrolase family 35 protein [Thermophilibacter mediterraneus]|uniref:glycoside hydrolase family 35 protein n=1 Tax=Thermophilibacter mediterraneus TaxID=1871031 RepID=UPI002353E959|nr:glycoside hydrolase family 35 protein [Thermophilibacter mediterraneus]